MNTIPLIFNEKQIRRTILGGTEAPQDVQVPAAAVLLNHSGNQYRDQTLDNLQKNGFESIISIESSQDNYLIEDLSRRFPAVTFVLLHEEATLGEMINTAVAETSAPYFFVLRDSLKITAQLINPRFFGYPGQTGSLVVSPRLFSRDMRPLPIGYAPAIDRSRFTVRVSPEISEGGKTLYPYDFVGLYNRGKFMQLGGFDHTITAPYWQNLDFALRAWLWGEFITLSPRLQISYDTDPVEPDASANAAYQRFYLKNIAPVVKTGYGYIPGSAFFSYWQRSRAGFFTARRQFSEGRRWVEANRFRFTQDIHSLCAAWEREAE
ncbi:MAG: hypothetical protein LBS97_06635 [Treponema sp.]|jgi:GT2 family glycosyltransferase|nr:hypothetical protein [Treponema sp.]